MDPNHTSGGGYAYLVAARNGARYPNQGLVFLNRGVGGQGVSDLAARWRNDTLDLKPDVLSILIGVNDADDAVNENPTRRMTLEQFRQTYDKLLAATVAALPNARLMLGEPFLLPSAGGRFHGK